MIVPGLLSTNGIFPSPVLFTRSGRDRPVLVPSPSWPCELSPQANTAPPYWDRRTASPKLEPAAIPTTPVRKLTRTGVRRLVVVLSPSWPLSLAPQAQTEPSPLSARLNEPLAAIATTPSRPVIRIGALWL